MAALKSLIASQGDDKNPMKMNITELPQKIIQLIQSFLALEEATETSLISKSWYKAWSTRRTLSFNLRHDLLEADPDFPRRTMHRYKKSNLKIDRFMVNVAYDIDYALADELILDALDLGVKDFYLKASADLSYVLPSQVFHMTSLTKLSIRMCKIDKLVDEISLCSSLVSLTLHDVSVNMDTIRDILLGCPLIEYIDVRECSGLCRINVTNLNNLKTFSIDQERCYVVFGEPRVFPTSVPEFRTLTSLHLKYAVINDAFFSECCSKFHCLEDLSVIHCRGYEEVKLYSHSIKQLSFIVGRDEKFNKAQLDVPNIVKFKYVDGFGRNPIPSLSFASSNNTSDKWEADIAFAHVRHMDKLSWFIKLREFLTALSGSKISLSLTDFMRCFITSCDSLLKNIPCVPCVPMVEKLELLGFDASMEFCAFVECLFRSFRPNLITRIVVGSNFPGFIHRKVMHTRFGERLDSKQIFSCIHNDDLKEVTLEVLEKTRVNWRPITRARLSDDRIIPKNTEQMRLQLRWG